MLKNNQKNKFSSNHYQYDKCGVSTGICVVFYLCLIIGFVNLGEKFNFCFFIVNFNGILKEGYELKTAELKNLFVQIH